MRKQANEEEYLPPSFALLLAELDPESRATQSTSYRCAARIRCSGTGHRRTGGASAPRKTPQYLRFAKVGERENVGRICLHLLNISQSRVAHRVGSALGNKHSRTLDIERRGYTGFQTASKVRSIVAWERILRQRSEVSLKYLHLLW